MDMNTIRQDQSKNGKSKKKVNSNLFGLKAMSHEAIFLATCNAMALHCKLQERLPRVTPHVCN